MPLRILKLSVWLLTGIIFLGCPVAYLGDRYVYGIEGDIYEAGSNNKISSVRVRVLCSESRLSGPEETISDNNGHSILKGYGAAYDCQLTFDHSGFERKVVKLDPDLREEPKGGLAWVWKVKVELEKKGRTVRSPRSPRG